MKVRVFFPDKDRMLEFESEKQFLESQKQLALGVGELVQVKPEPKGVPELPRDPETFRIRSIYLAKYITCVFLMDPGPPGPWDRRLKGGLRERE